MRLIHAPSGAQFHKNGSLKPFLWNSDRNQCVSELHGVPCNSAGARVLHFLAQNPCTRTTQKMPERLDVQGVLRCSVRIIVFLDFFMEQRISQYKLYTVIFYYLRYFGPSVYYITHFYRGPIFANKVNSSAGYLFHIHILQHFRIGCRMTVFHFSGGTFLASDR